MSISVTCPSCSASFKVKDEYAGKRAKCPKCAGPIVVPAVVDTVLMPPPAKAAAPVAAKPVVASKPKPPADDEDEAPAPKRKRGEEDDEAPKAKKRGRDEDEKPTGKRKRDDDAQDDAPKGKPRRRRDDDDEPKKKGKALPIILGILGGVLVVCVGGCAGVWFGVIVPAADKAKAENDRRQAELNRWESEFAKPPVNPGANPFPGPAPATDPTPTSTPGTGSRPRLGRRSTAPVATLTPDEFVRDRDNYIGKWVIVKGKVAEDVTDITVWGDFQMEHKGEKKMSWDGSTWASSVEVKKGATVEVWGLVVDPMYLEGRKLQLRSCLMFAPSASVTAAELLDEHLATPPNKSEKYDGRPIRLTGKVVRSDSFYTVMEERTVKGVVHQVKVHFEDDLDKPLQPGDIVTVFTSGRYLQDSGDGKKEIVMTSVRFLSPGK